MCARKFAVELKLRRGVFPFLDIIVEHTLGLIIDNEDALQGVERCGQGRLNDLICIFQLVDVSTLVTGCLVESFDVTFLMLRQVGGIGMVLCESETPGLVTQWKDAGE